MQALRKGRRTVGEELSWVGLYDARNRIGVPETGTDRAAVATAEEHTTLLTRHSGNEVRFQQFATRHLHAAGAPDTIAASYRSDAFGEASDCRPKSAATGSGKMSTWPASMSDTEV
jgi:hypothetical protein